MNFNRGNSSKINKTIQTINKKRSIHHGNNMHSMKRTSKIRTINDFNKASNEWKIAKRSTEFRSWENRPSTSNSAVLPNLLDPTWERIDPCPDIRALFVEYNKRFFWSRLGMVEVKWSPRMTTCAGICRYQYPHGLCTIGLSKPLLTLRPRSDLVNTLLHEMIHAYLFVTDQNTDHDGHGDNFKKHMHRINREAGTMITIYHNFHREVRHYKVHQWRCTGPCRVRPPFFGWVKRAINRAPGPNDFWWPEHKASCSGTFIKVNEPDNFNKKKVKETVSNHNVKSKQRTINKFFPTLSKNTDEFNNSTPPQQSNFSKAVPTASSSAEMNNAECPICQRSFDVKVIVDHVDQCNGQDRNEYEQAKLEFDIDLANDDIMLAMTPVDVVECPVCESLIEYNNVNAHLDQCAA